MTPELSRRLGKILGSHVVTPTERTKIVKAAQGAGSWGDLPKGIRDLLAKVKARPTAASLVPTPTTKDWARQRIVSDYPLDIQDTT